MFDSEKDAQAEKLIRDYHRVIAFFETNQAGLEQQGIDVAAKLTQTKNELAALEKICAQAEEAEQNYLQAAADLADKETEVFNETSKMIDQLQEANPADPRIEELVRKRDQWKKHFPKT